MKSKTVLPGVFAEALYLVTGFSTAGAEADVGKLPRASGREVVFAADIKPILERSCFQCHGPTRPKGRFRVDSREAILEGGKSDQAAILPGKSASSPLVHYVAGLVKEMEMPPLDKRDKYPPLAQGEIALMRAWIDQGAKWPEGAPLSGAFVNAAEKEEPGAVIRERIQPFFEAIRQGDSEGIAQFLQDRSLLDLRDENGNTPPIQAAFYLDAKRLELRPTTAMSRPPRLPSGLSRFMPRPP